MATLSATIFLLRRAISSCCACHLANARRLFLFIMPVSSMLVTPPASPFQVVYERHLPAGGDRIGCPGWARTIDIWINSPPFYRLNYRTKLVLLRELESRLLP